MRLYLLVLFVVDLEKNQLLDLKTVLEVEPKVRISS